MRTPVLLISKRRRLWQTSTLLCLFFLETRSVVESLALPRTLSVHRPALLNRHTFGRIQPWMSSSPSFDGWQAGDVDADFYRLEQGIRKSNAEGNLSQSLRRQCLDYMAQQRRPLANLAPRMVSVAGLTGLWMFMIRQASAGNKAAVMIRQLCGLGFSVHFWVVLVWLPTFLFWALNAAQSHPNRGESTAQSTATSFRRKFFLPVWRDPFEFSDYQVSRHLVEHWLACVSTMLFLYPFIPATTPWRHFSRLSIRLAVPVSWRLYEKMWFLLVQRSQYIRPVSWSLHVLQLVTQHMLLTPVAVAWELALWSITIGLGYRAAASLVAYALVILVFAKWSNPSSDQLRSISKFFSKIPIKSFLACGIGGLSMKWTWLNRQLVNDAYLFLRNQSLSQLPHWSLPTFPILQVLATVVACVPPVAYLMVRLRRIRLCHSHDASLAAEPEAFISHADADQNLSWRYRYEWYEEPESVLDILRKIRENFWYNVLLKGSVEEKLRRDITAQYNKVARASNVHILDRIRGDIEKMPESFAVDRTMWKQRAMDFQAKIHEQNWARRNIDDPLGLALYLNTGVSLGLRFDQDKAMLDGENLSNRRLQARAVKSAIHRTRQIYNDTAKKILALDVDPEERERQKRELRKQADEEIHYIAKRMVELIPTDLDLEQPVGLFIAPDLKKVSPNEYVVDKSTGDSDVLKGWRETILGSTGNTESFDVLPMVDSSNPNIGSNRTDDEPPDIGRPNSGNRTDVADYLHNSTERTIEASALKLDRAKISAGQEAGMSRRDAIRRSTTILVAGTFISGKTLQHQWQVLQQSSKPIAELNFTRVFRESSIDITVDGPMNREFLNSQTFQKVQTLKLPRWVPSFFVPAPQVVRDITNIELLTASAIAGSLVEIARTTLLYPLLTLKTRVQTDVKSGMRRRPGRSLHIRRRLQITQLKARKHLREGKLYAGIWPSLLISVPATGLYFAVRDVAIRKLIPYTDALGGSISVALLAALIADVVSLIVRTPADTLAVRLQSATGEEYQWEESQSGPVSEAARQYYLQEKIGNWFLESFERIPAVILTDLPFLLSRIALSRLLLQGGPVSLGRYEGIVLFSAILCSFLTTPFDVARTRILVDSDDDPNNGIDGGSGEGLVRTFQTIINEGDGSIRNLFAGWLERVAYFGIGRAWIEPLQILGYIAIRDFILLEWF